MAIRPRDHGKPGKENFTISWTRGLMGSEIDVACTKGNRSARVQQLCMWALDIHKRNRAALHQHEQWLSKEERVNLFTIYTIMFDPLVSGTIQDVGTSTQEITPLVLAYMEENRLLLEAKYGIDLSSAANAQAHLDEHFFSKNISYLYTLIDSVQLYHLKYHAWEQSGEGAEPLIVDILKGESSE